MPETSEDQHIIDCDADPVFLEKWSIEEHKKNGQIEWDASKVVLYLSEVQKEGDGLITGNDLHAKLAQQSVFNACILDYLLAHPELIPEEWKDKCVFFWGTIYRDARGSLCVRCLCWSDDEWRWYSRGLEFDFKSSDPAAVLCE